VGIKDVLKAISEALSKPFSAVNTRSISEDNLRLQLADTKWAINNTLVSFNTIGQQTFNVCHDRVRQLIKQDPRVAKAVGPKLVGFINDLDKNLKGTAQQFGLYKTIVTTLTNMIKVIDKLEDELPHIVDSGIVVSELTVTQSIFLGTVESYHNTANACDYIFVLFSNVVSKSSSAQLQKYIGEYLIEHSDMIFGLFNRMVYPASVNDSINAIRNIKSKGMDIGFTVGAKTGIFKTAVTFGLTGLEIVGIVTLLMIFFTSMGGITYVGEIYVDIRHTYYERLKDQKLWLEAHLANIKLSLSDMDPNDPEYLKLQKTVEFYNDKIASLDKKIDSYYDK
jgi:hypothetical protein